MSAKEKVKETHVIAGVHRKNPPNCEFGYCHADSKVPADFEVAKVSMNGRNVNGSIPMCTACATESCGKAAVERALNVRFPATAS